MSHPWMAAVDLKDMIFMFPLKPEGQERFAWGGIQYTFTQLPPGFRHSPALSNQDLADDVLMEGDSSHKVQRMHYRIIVHLGGKGITIPEE